MLLGTEIKSIRNNQANLSDAHCVFVDDELFVRNLHIAEYNSAGYANHRPKRERKLLLNRQELNKRTFARNSVRPLAPGGLPRALVYCDAWVPIGARGAEGRDFVNCCWH